MPPQKKEKPKKHLPKFISTEDAVVLKRHFRRKHAVKKMLRKQKMRNIHQLKKDLHHQVPLTLQQTKLQALLSRSQSSEIP